MWHQVLYPKHKEGIIQRLLKMLLSRSHHICQHLTTSRRLCEVFYIHHHFATQNVTPSLQVGKLRLRLVQLFAQHHTAGRIPDLSLEDFRAPERHLPPQVSWPHFSVSWKCLAQLSQVTRSCMSNIFSPLTLLKYSKENDILSPPELTGHNYRPNNLHHMVRQTQRSKQWLEINPDKTTNQPEALPHPILPL